MQDIADLAGDSFLQSPDVFLLQIISKQHGNVYIAERILSLVGSGTEQVR